MGAGMEIGEDVCIHWTTLYDEILFIHKGTMIVRTDAGELECKPGDIVWLPEGVTLDYDMTGGRCEYFSALYPFDWAKRRQHGRAIAQRASCFEGGCAATSHEAITIPSSRGALPTAMPRRVSLLTIVV